MTAGSGETSHDDRQSEIDDLRAALAAQEAASAAEHARLTYELGHRVKNTLSMVQALANQTFRGNPDSEGGLQTFSQRVMALARANDAILKESWTTATLNTVAAAVLVPDGHPLGPVTIEGPAQRMAAGGALSFALALHELSTNAKRYGAWRDAGGSVALLWNLGEDAEGARLDLQWTEAGGPPVAEPPKRGFGLRFAERSLRSAFGRDVAFAFPPGGFTCHIVARPDTLGA